MTSIQQIGFRPDDLASAYAVDPRVMRKPSEILSVNVFFRRLEHKTEGGANLCKTNCRSIEVSVLLPFSSSSVPLSNLDGFEDEERRGEGADISRRALEHPAEQMESNTDAAQEPDTSRFGLSRVLTSTSIHRTTSSPSSFNFLSLPIELRLKIYALLLPLRNHTIVTQIPHNGYFYNTATIPTHSAQSFYPFGVKPPSQNHRQGSALTTYKVLSSNFHRSYPHESIHPAIIGVSRQIKVEAKAVLYGNGATVWDFGVHLDACRAFWADRGREARALCRTIRVAWEIPVLGDTKANNGKWLRFCEWMKEEMTGLRTLDLTLWTSTGSVASFPVSMPAGLPTSAANAGDWQDQEAVLERKRDEETKWREWEWIQNLLQIDSLRTARITWWGFENVGTGGDVEGHFDSWLAGRMVGDRFVRDRMVRDGVVVEGVVVLNGNGRRYSMSI